MEADNPTHIIVIGMIFGMESLCGQSCLLPGGGGRRCRPSGILQRAGGGRPDPLCGIAAAVSPGKRLAGALSDAAPCRRFSLFAEEATADCKEVSNDEISAYTRAVIQNHSSKKPKRFEIEAYILKV